MDLGSDVSNRHKQVVNKLLMRHAKNTIPGVCCILYAVCCMVVPHSYENKAISAPSWGLAGWGLG